jgi:hypothetical protein
MPKLTARCLTALSCLALLAACTPGNQNHESGERPPPPPPSSAEGADAGEAPPEPVAPTTVSIASVQMIQDCPTPGAPALGGAAPAMRASEPMRPAPGGTADGSGRGFHQPCTQSTVQLALETRSTVPVAVEIQAVRLRSGTKSLTTLQTREPTAWRDNSYVGWDEQVSIESPVKASYKLSLPDDWTAIEAAIGESSFGHMFTLEIDVAIDGVVQTVSSPEFPREQPHVVVT